jgi:hypothetical protein
MKELDVPLNWRALSTSLYTVEVLKIWLYRTYFFVAADTLFRLI